MISLKHQKPFARGTHRACYRHPGREDLCVKVMTEHWTRNKRWTKIPKWLRPFRSKWRFHENLTEMRFTNLLWKRIGDSCWDFIPRSHELVETDIGEGLTVDLVRNHDGTIALSLAEYIWRNGLTDECRKAIDGMWENFRRHRIFASGRPDNVAVSVAADGSCKCYAIDALGLPSFIPLAMYIPAKARKRFEKLMASQNARIEALLEKRESESAEEQKGFLL